MKQPGHGPGTLSILAGRTVKLPQYHYNGYLGVHGNIRIVPVRIAKSVVLWKNKAFTDALEYVLSLYDNPDTRCHIICMSMGGMPSKAWADAVNRAYEKGIFIVTAAGNNFGRITPSTLVYPARFKRVTATCGVTFDYSPYYKPVSPAYTGTMQGNFGPRKAMNKAIAAFTPNVPWALYHTESQVSINGAGTSSATPQVAAAAAIYYQRHYEDLEKLKGWEIVEKIRGAMYQSAARKITGKPQEDIRLYFGNGILQAGRMLAISPGQVDISYQEPDEVSWPFLKMITGLSVLETTEVDDDGTREMYETEILQLISRSAGLQELLGHEERSFDELSEEEQKIFIKSIYDAPETSASLRALIASLQII
ncbi:S8 family serine peptidase [Mucilaginibacter sp.]|uniref:S8 family serine peptidase n=1 Tax=Mucilaginibacter sp. TaxID=1882438 RepID=UPI0035BBF392